MQPLHKSTAPTCGLRPSVLAPNLAPNSTDWGTPNRSSRTRICTEPHVSAPDLAGDDQHPPDEVRSDRWSVPDRHERWVLDWNDRRLAVFDRDVDAIVRTHARDRKVAAWLQDTAQAFEEIGEIDLAIDWAHQATDHAPGHQSLKAAEYWCELLARHRPAEQLAAREEVFRRWPSATTATRLHRAAGTSWHDYHDDRSTV